jgi:hypothetical protein
LLTPIRISSIFFLGRYDLLLAPSGDSERIAAFVALCPNERASNASLWHFCLVQAKDADMRDFRNAKAMAQTLRAALSSKGTKITVSESLELVAEVFGVADWNTLTAAIRTGDGGTNISPQLLPVVGSDRAIPFSAAQPHVGFWHETGPAAPVGRCPLVGVSDLLFYSRASLQIHSFG